MIAGVQIKEEEIVLNNRAAFELVRSGSVLYLFPRLAVLEGAQVVVFAGVFLACFPEKHLR